MHMTIAMHMGRIIISLRTKLIFRSPAYRRYQITERFICFAVWLQKRPPGIVVMNDSTAILFCQAG